MRRYGTSLLVTHDPDVSDNRTDKKANSCVPISKMTEVYEGSLIRTFRRLEETMRQMAQAAKVMGSAELEGKFETALSLVKRDIVAAQSLYL